MKVLIINGGSRFPPNNTGKLNTAISEEMQKYLTSKGFEAKITKCDTDYDAAEEADKIYWADVIIWQFPGWWMGCPWQVKKYMDQVFMTGVGKLFKDDGRTRSDASKKYGSGGLSQNKKYLLSTTWNAPEEAFTDPNQFFEGKGIDGVLFPFHKANQFLGMKPLPTFICNDVIKNFDLDKIFDSLHKHLDTVFA